MKRFLIILALAPVAFVSCITKVDDLFDKSAGERIDEAMREYDLLLRSNADGWLVEYFPEITQAYGGYNLFFKFGDEGNVVVGSEIDPDEFAESLYRMNSDMGPTLNFDTYNPVLHYFSDPSLNVGGGKGLGYEGDYEFVMMDGNESEIIMRGKKTHNTIRLTPLPDGMSWAEYNEKVATIYFYTTPPNYDMTVGGEQVWVRRSYNYFQFAYKVENDSGGTDWAYANAPFIYTATGIKFYEPVEFLGESMQYFTLDTSENLLRAEGADARIYMLFAAVNDYFVSSSAESQWVFTGDFSPALQTVWNTVQHNLDYYSMTIVGDWKYLGKSLSSQYAGPSLFFKVNYSGYIYPVCYAYTFTSVAGTDDQINMVSGKSYEYGDWGTYYFQPFIDCLNNNSPYRLTPDDAIAPTTIRFDSVDNPDIYFTVIMKKPE